MTIHQFSQQYETKNNDNKNTTTTKQQEKEAALHPLCPSCIQNKLTPKTHLHQTIRSERDAIRDQLLLLRRRRSTSASSQQLPYLSDQTRTLRNEVSSLKQQCRELTMKIAECSVQNDEEEQEWMKERESVDSGLMALDRLTASILAPSSSSSKDEYLKGGSLTDAMSHGMSEMIRMRRRLALGTFEMHRMDIGSKQQQQQQQQQEQARKVPNGVGTIGGLPLPHAGLALYSVLPPNVLSSSLRLVASLTCTVAKCLGIALPHPILLSTGQGGDDILDDCVDVSKQRGGCRWWEEGWRNSSSISALSRGDDDDGASLNRDESLSSLPTTGSPSSSASGLVSTLIGSHSSLGRALSAGANVILGEGMNGTRKPPPLDTRTEMIQRRIRHATCAIIRESVDVNSAEYALVPANYNEQGHKNKTNHEKRQRNSTRHGDDEENEDDPRFREEQFAIGLQLLQNDVVALCIRSGVAVSTLWPAEALLLNMDSLRCHLEEFDVVSERDI